MATKLSKTSAKDVQKDSKSRLIEAGIRLFATHGFDGTTTRDLVEATGLNISLINYHFGGKEGLLDACLEHVANEVNGQAARVLTPPQNVNEFQARLRDYIQHFLGSSVANPHLNRLVHKELERDSPSFHRVLKSSYVNFFKKLVTFFTEAQAHGFMRLEVDPLNMAFSLNGAINQHLRLEGIRHSLLGDSLSDQSFRAKVVEDILNTFCYGVLIASHDS